MNRPEPIDLIVAIERCLAISTEDAVEVLDRASRDALWPYRHDLEIFEEVVRSHWAAIRRERDRPARRGGRRGQP